MRAARGQVAPGSCDREHAAGERGPGAGEARRPPLPVPALVDVECGQDCRVRMLEIPPVGLRLARALAGEQRRCVRDRAPLPAGQAEDVGDRGRIDPCGLGRAQPGDGAVAAQMRQRELRHDDHHRERGEREHPQRPDQHRGYDSEREHRQEGRQHLRELGAHQDAWPVALVEGREGESREEEVDGVHQQPRRVQRGRGRAHRRGIRQLERPVSRQDREREAAHRRDEARREQMVLADHETADRVRDDPDQERRHGAGDHQGQERQDDARVEIRPDRPLQPNLGGEGDRCDRCERAEQHGLVPGRRRRKEDEQADRDGRRHEVRGHGEARARPRLPRRGANVSVSPARCLASVRAHLHARLNRQPNRSAGKGGRFEGVLAAAEAHPGLSSLSLGGPSGGFPPANSLLKPTNP